MKPIRLILRDFTGLAATAGYGDKVEAFKTQSRIDTPIEIEYYRDGGILRTVLKKLLKG